MNSPLNFLQRIDALIVEDEPLSEKTWKPPADVAAEAQKVIDWKDEHGRDEVDAMKQTGWERAHQLAGREKVSWDVIKRMRNFFNRHDGNQKIADEHKDEPWKDNGHVSWLGWGGDPGRDWANEIYDKHHKEDG